MGRGGSLLPRACVSYAEGMQTSIRVDVAQRDALARVAAERQESQDQALRRLIWEHDCATSLARLEADPVALYDYEVETGLFGNAATEVDG